MSANFWIDLNLDTLYFSGRVCKVSGSSIVNDGMLTVTSRGLLFRPVLDQLKLEVNVARIGSVTQVRHGFLQVLVVQLLDGQKVSWIAPDPAQLHGAVMAMLSRYASTVSGAVCSRPANP